MESRKRSRKTTRESSLVSLAGLRKDQSIEIWTGKGLLSFRKASETAHWGSIAEDIEIFCICTEGVLLAFYNVTISRKRDAASLAN